MEPSTITTGLPSVHEIAAERVPAFELERFEHVRASAARVLLRLTGRATPEGAEVAVVVEAGRRRERLAAVPSPGGASGQWAFSAPSDLLTPDASWLAEVAGELVPIPNPVEREAPPVTPETELARERAARKRAEAQLATLRRRLADMELEVATYQAELDQARSRARSVEAESDAARRELEADIEASRRELDDQRQALGARASAAEDELAHLRTDGREHLEAEPGAGSPLRPDPLESPLRTITGRPGLADS